MSDWTDNLPPAERLAAMHERLREAGDAYIEADMQARSWGRTRARTLNMMVDLRWKMRHFAAENGLDLPPSRWAALLESESE